MSYGTKIYKTDNGDELVVADGGKITIESGGELGGIVLASTVGDGETLTIASGGELSVAAGGAITAAGTQAAHIADVADAAGAAPNAAEFNAAAAAINAILAALEGAGILASS